MYANIGTEMFIGQFLIHWMHMRAYWRFISGTLWVIMHGGYQPKNYSFYSGFLQSAIGVNAVTNAFNCTVKPVFKGHCDEG